MALGKHTVEKTTLTDVQLDELYEKHMNRILVDTRKKGYHGGLLTLYKLETPKAVEARSTGISASTKLGYANQDLLFEIVSANDRFANRRNSRAPAKGEEKIITDIQFTGKTNCKDRPEFAQKKMYFLFVQSSPETKNGDGNEAIKKKIADSPDDIVFVTVILQDYPPEDTRKRWIYKEATDSSPAELILIGHKVFEFLSDGDETLYRRYFEANDRWKLRHIQRLTELFPESAELFQTLRNA